MEIGWRERVLPRLSENLDLTPIHPILWKDLQGDGPGRPVEYDPERALRALMLRQIELIPCVMDLVKRLRRDSYIRKVCGYGENPMEAHLSQMKSRLGYGRLTWRGQENAGIHVSLVLMVVYVVAISAFRIGRPELRQSVAFFA